MKLMTEYGLDKLTATTLVNTVIDNAVSLLLGAGASFGCQGGDDVEIRGGIDLAREINNALGIGLAEPDASNLQLVYGDASQPHTKLRLNNLLRGRFTNCSPTWQGVLFAVRWKRIWNLNIDDVIQRSQPVSAKFPLKPFNWFEAFQPRSFEREEIQLIYLHGRAIQLDDYPDHLIFSLKEYVNRQEAVPGWHTEFRSEFAQKPFIVCGARLQDEVDLISVIEYGNRSLARGGCPSIVVLREFAPGQEDRFRRQGLIPIAATGEEFFRALVSDVVEFKSRHPDVHPVYALAKSELKEKFRRLDLQPDREPRRTLDFYSSVETQWNHIIDDLDASRHDTESVIKYLTRTDTNRVKVALISGGPVSGKTAIGYRIGKLLLADNYEVWLFRGEQVFDAMVLIPYLTNTNKVVLLFDDCADYSIAIGQLAVEAQKNNTPLRVVATCDNHRLRAVQVDISTRFRNDYGIEPVRQIDFKSIFTKRLNKGRMGRLTSTSVDVAWREFRVNYSNRLLEWLESLENAYPYRDAIVEMFGGKSQADAEVMNILRVTAAAQRFGYSLPFYVTDTFRGKESLDVLTGEGGKLEQLAYIDDRGLRLRSSAFARFVWSQLNTIEKYKWSMFVVRNLAPLVVPRTITKRSLPYLIARQIMDWEHVEQDLGADSEKWFGELEPVFGWNARFWEQRALLASNTKNELLAYSYARKAIERHEQNSFPWTTLGKVCVKIGVEREDQVGVERFWEGVEALEKSRKISADSGHEWEHPFVTFFAYALKASRCEHFQHERVRLNQAWLEWMREAQRSNIFLPTATGRNSQLDDFQRKWLLNVVVQN